MSTYLISDIHGCNKTFQAGLKSIDFKKTDTLIILGDLIDRGPDSKGVLDAIITLIDTGFNVICLKGNHEAMLLSAFEDDKNRVNWILNGGSKTLSNFLTSSIERIPNQYIDFISSFKNYHILENYIFVHAGINMLLDEPLSDHHSLFWLRDWREVYDETWLGDRIIIHGHTPTDSRIIKGSIDNKDKVICIDNGCFLNTPGFGSLCIIRLEDFNVYFENNCEK